jgi:uncharacterized protein YoaH (UPF0181 family)
MNEEAFNTMYILAQKEGYKKTPEEFKTLLSSNQEALNTMYSIAQREGYKKTPEEFKTLLGVSGVEGEPVNFTEGSVEQQEQPTEPLEKPIVDEVNSSPYAVTTTSLAGRNIEKPKTKSAFEEALNKEIASIPYTVVTKEEVDVFKEAFSPVQGELTQTSEEPSQTSEPDLINKIDSEVVRVFPTLGQDPYFKRKMRLKMLQDGEFANKLSSNNLSDVNKFKLSQDILAEKYNLLSQKASDLEGQPTIENASTLTDLNNTVAQYENLKSDYSEIAKAIKKQEELVVQRRGEYGKDLGIRTLKSINNFAVDMATSPAQLSSMLEDVTGRGELYTISDKILDWTEETFKDPIGSDFVASDRQFYKDGEIDVPAALLGTADQVGILVGLAAGNYYAGLKTANALNQSKNIAVSKELAMKTNQSISTIGGGYFASLASNRKEAKEMGLKGLEAANYSNTMSLIEGLSELVMPNNKLFSPELKALSLDTYVKALAKGSTSKLAMKEALQVVSENIGKENLEEILVMAGKTVQTAAISIDNENIDIYIPTVEEVINTVATTSIAAGIPSIISQRNVSKNVKNQALIKASENINQTKDVLQGYVSKGIVSGKEANSLLEKLGAVNQSVKEIPNNLPLEKQGEILEIAEQLTNLRTQLENKKGVAKKIIQDEINTLEDKIFKLTEEVAVEDVATPDSFIFSEEAYKEAQRFVDDAKTKKISIEEVVNNDPTATELDKKLISALSPFLKGKNVYYQDGFNYNISNELVDDSGGYGATISENGDILVFDKNNLNTEIILHEGLHSLVFTKINETTRNEKDQVFVDEIQRIFDFVRNDSDLVSRYDYAFTNLDEFISEAFGNRNFRQELSYISDETSGVKSNVFKSFIDSIRKFLKLEYNFEIDNSALESILNAVDYTLQDKRDTTQETSDLIEEQEYTQFVDEGVVSEERIQSIADKVRQQQELTPREQEIFTDKTSEVNQKIAEFAPTEEVSETVETISPLPERLKNVRVARVGDTFDRGKRGEAINEKEIEEAQSVLMDELNEIENSNLPQEQKDAASAEVEKLFNELENYELTTETKTRQITQKRPTRVVREGVKEQTKSPQERSINRAVRMPEEEGVGVSEEINTQIQSIRDKIEKEKQRRSETRERRKKKGITKEPAGRIFTNSFKKQEELEQELERLIKKEKQGRVEDKAKKKEQVTVVLEEQDGKIVLQAFDKDGSRTTAKELELESVNDLELVEALKDDDGKVIGATVRNKNNDAEVFSIMDEELALDYAIDKTKAEVGEMSIEEESVFEEYEEVKKRPTKKKPTKEVVKEEVTEKVEPTKPITEETLTEEETSALDDILGFSGQKKRLYTDNKSESDKKRLKRVNNALDKIEDSFQKIFPNLYIGIAEDSDMFARFAKEQNTSKESRSRGVFTPINVEGEPKRYGIILNPDFANVTTAFHEAFHALMKVNGFNNEQARAVTSRMIKSVQKGATPELNENLETFVSQYETPEQSEEYMAELFGILSYNYSKQSGTVKGIIKRWLRKLAEILGLKPKNTLLSSVGLSDSDAATVNMLNVLADKMSRGKVLSKEDVTSLRMGGPLTAQQVAADMRMDEERDGVKKSKTQSKIDISRVRSKYRPGKRVSKGVAVKGSKDNKTITETEGLSIAYVKKEAPQAFIKNANILAKEDIVSGKKKFGEIKTESQAQEVYDIFTREVADNLIFLTEKFNKKYKDISTLWYDGANILAQDLSKKYDVSTEQVAGIIASLSPQKDWYQNVRLAELALMTYKDNPVMTQDMVDFQQKVSDTGLNGPKGARTRYKKSRTKKNKDELDKKLYQVQKVQDALTSLIGTKIKDADPAYQAYYVRLYTELNVTKDYNILRPDGEVMQVATKKDGTKSKVAWGSYVEIGKAVSMYNNGSQENITKTLGEMHKIRNFYNNIIDPMSKDGDVTIDTHAVAAGLLKPLSGNSREVGNNFGTGTSNSGAKGIKGVYYAYLDAYALAAKELGLLPRQVQSITWEAVRGLYTDSFKRDSKKTKSIQDIWERYRDGKITINEARDEAIKKGGGINNPTWAESVSKGVDKPTSDIGRRGDRGVRDIVGRDKRGGIAPETESIKKSKRQPREQYPLEDIGRWWGDADYKSRGGELVYMTPDEFLSKAKPLKMDEDTKENIDDLVSHIEEGRKLDPLILYSTDKTDVRSSDGRHRAYAAKELNINSVPVVDFTSPQTRKKSKRQPEKNKKLKEAIEFAKDNNLSPKKLNNYLLGRGYTQEEIDEATPVKSKPKESIKKLINKVSRLTDNNEARAIVAKELRELLKDSKLSQFSKRTINKVITSLKNTNVSNMQKMLDKVDDAISNDEGRAERIKRYKNRSIAIKRIAKIGPLKELQDPFIRMMGIDPKYLSKESQKEYDSVLSDILNINKKYDKTSRDTFKAKIDLVLDSYDIDSVRAKEIADRINELIDPNKTLNTNLARLEKDKKITKEERELITRFKSLLDESSVADPMAGYTEEEIEEYKGMLEAEKREGIEEDFIETLSQPQSAFYSADDTGAFKLSEEERRYVKEANSITLKDIQELSLRDAKSVVRALEAMKAGFLTPELFQGVIKVRGVRGNMSIPLNEIKESGFIDKISSKISSSIFNIGRKKKITGIGDRLRSAPTKNYEQVLKTEKELLSDGSKRFKGTNIYKSLFKPTSTAFSKSEQTLNRIEDKLKNATALLSRNQNERFIQKAKIMVFQIQREYDSNVGNKEVNQAKDWINATIKDKDTALDERDIIELEKIRDRYLTDGQVDAKKLYDSLTANEKKHLQIIDGVYDELTFMARMDAAVQGMPFIHRENYIHLPKSGTKTSEISNDFEPLFDSFMNASVKNKAAIQRTGKTHSISFDPVSNAYAAARKISVGYHMYPVIKSARVAFSGLKNRAETRFEKDLVNELESIYDRIINSQYKNVTKNKILADNIFRYLTKAGYFSQLGGVVKAASELGSNTLHAVMNHAGSFVDGYATLVSVNTKTIDKALENTDTTQMDRLTKTAKFDSKDIEGKLLSKAKLFNPEQMTGELAASAKTVGKVAAMPFQTVFKLNESLITKPDEMVIRPLFVGEFQNRFKQLTGQKLNWEKLANDESYRDRFQEAINQASEQADSAVIDTSASTNPFDTIPSNISDPDASNWKKAFQVINRYMTNFRVFEYYSAVKGVQNSLGKGEISIGAGMMLLASTIMRMSIYRLGIDYAFGLIFSALGMDEDEDEIKKEDLTRNVLSGIVTLAFGRNLGNLTQSVINFGIETANMKFGEGITWDSVTKDGDKTEYDPYKGMVFSKYPVKPRPGQDVFLNVVIGLSGALAPVIKTTARGVTLANRSIYNEKKESRDKNKNELFFKTPFDVAGSLGFIPNYKDLKKINNRYWFGGNRDTEKKTKGKILGRTRTQSSRTSSTGRKAPRSNRTR